jgi:hypothetical protein
VGTNTTPEQRLIKSSTLQGFHEKHRLPCCLLQADGYLVKFFYINNTASIDAPRKGKKRKIQNNIISKRVPGPNVSYARATHVPSFFI